MEVILVMHQVLVHDILIVEEIKQEEYMVVEEPRSNTDTLEYITIQSEGNGVDFGKYS